MTNVYRYGALVGVILFACTTIFVHLVYAAPVISLTANPQSVQLSGGQNSARVTLTWNVTAGDRCGATDGWSGAKALSGSEQVTVTQTTTFALTCVNDGTSARKAVTVVVTGGSTGSTGGTTGTTGTTGGSTTGTNTTGGTTNTTGSTGTTNTTGGTSGSSTTGGTTGTTGTNTTTTTGTGSTNTTGGTTGTTNGTTGTNTTGTNTTGTNTTGTTGGTTTGTATGGTTGTASISAPTSLSGSARDPASIALAWTAPSGNGVAGYKVYRNGQHVGSVALTSFTDVGLTADTSYEYRVSALATGGGESQLSAAITIETPEGDQPTLTFSANPVTIPLHQLPNPSQASSTLTWSSSDATNCTASGGWTGSKPPDGTEVMRPTADTTYTLTCVGEGGTITKSVTVTLQTANTAAIDCHLVTNVSQVPTNFGSPFDVFATGNVLNLRASCTTTRALLSAGTGNSSQWIYGTGYEYRNQRWQPVVFAGSAPAQSGWVRSAATAEVGREAAEMAQNNFFVVYICTYTNGGYKCGCRDQTCTTPQWQLQGFRRGN